MVMYRRARLAGGSYFFTLALADRRTDLLVRHVDLLRDAFRQARARRSFRIDAIVVLPEHLHMVMSLPEGDGDFSNRIASMKVSFVRSLRSKGYVLKPTAKREVGIWQPRFWEHVLRDERDFAAHVDYIHINPLKHGLARRVIDWPYSSFHRYVRDGVLPVDWAGGEEGDVPEAGERQS
ncbi:REP-associated tyrosine transposase [Pseudomonas solani]|uniref:REP-associated tyrosine transposase n=1 Tax=Pseudomonas solani TaxID=2731552 RepID=UPI003C2FF129